MRLPALRRANSSNLSMTPMIDVVFLLLIFFVVAASGQLREFTLTLELTGDAIQSSVTTPKDDEPKTSRVWIVLRRENAQTAIRLIITYDKSVSAAGLQKARVVDGFNNLETTMLGLAGEDRDIPVVLDVGKKVPGGDFVRVRDICEKAKFNNFNFAVDPGEVVGEL